MNIIKNKLLTGSFTYGSIMILTRVSSIIMIPILTHNLSTEEYGILNLLLTLILITNSIISLEIPQSVSVFFPLSVASERKQFPSTALKVLFFNYSIFIMLIITYSNLISDNFFNNSISSDLIIACSILMSVNGIYLLLQNQFRIEFNVRNYALISIGYIFLTTIGTILGIYYFKAGVKGIIWCQAIGVTMVIILSIFSQLKNYNNSFSYYKLKTMLLYSTPLVPTVLFQLGGQQISKYILSIYCTFDEVGIYSLASQIASFAALSVIGVQTAITPSILKNYKDIETPKMLARLFERFTIFALIICAFISIFSNEIISVFSSTPYQKAKELVPLLSFSVALNSFYIFFPGKLIYNKSGSQLIASASSFFVAAFMGFILIEIDGSRGAVLATFFSSLIFFIIWFRASQKLYPLPVSWFHIYYSISLVSISCYITNTNFFNITGIYEIIAKFLIFILMIILIVKKYYYDLKKFFI